MKKSHLLFLLPSLGLTIGFGQAGGAPLPRPDHIVVVIEENTNLNGLMNTDDAEDVPFIMSLIRDNNGKPSGALFTQSYGVSHPSQPNYFALFAGDAFGLEKRPERGRYPWLESPRDKPLEHNLPVDTPNLLTALHKKSQLLGTFPSS